MLFHMACFVRFIFFDLNRDGIKRIVNGGQYVPTMIMLMADREILARHLKFYMYFRNIAAAMCMFW